MAPATAALLRGPRSVSVDAQGNLFVADTENNRLRMVAPGGRPHHKRRLALTSSPTTAHTHKGPGASAPGPSLFPAVGR